MTTRNANFARPLPQFSIYGRLVAVLNIDYSFDATTRIASLYEIAKEKAWNAAKDLSWKSSAGDNDQAPIVPTFSPFCGFHPYESATAEDRDLANRKWHAMEVSEILHGEQGALLIASQLVQLMPDLSTRLFASSQVFDEARHVEFFTRYLSQHVGSIHPPSAHLSSLLQFGLADDRIDIKLITMQIVIESLAMAKFQRLRTSTAVPLLKAALDYILKDEARHVSFGVEIMVNRVEQMSPSVKNERADFALDAVTKLASNLNAPALVANEFDWDERELRRHLRLKRISDPSEAKAIFRQLQINLNAVGLLTDQLRTKLSAQGLFAEL